MKLPVKYSDLPLNAVAAFTIWDIYGSSKAVPVGGTVVSLFGKHGLVSVVCTSILLDVVIIPSVCCL